MSRRLELHQILVDILGSSNVYFQPPASVQMKYPCIIYGRIGLEPKYANNRLYMHKKRYQVTVVDKNPDSIIPGKVLKLPLCKFDRHYNKDNLNHDVYTLYF